MVIATMQDLKLMTRRIIKPTKKIENPEYGYTAFTPKGSISVRGKHENGRYGESFIKCPHGEVGDLLWVRETFLWDWADYPERTKKYYVHKADNPNFPMASGEHWKPSIFMPKDACRIFLEITDIRAELLQDISFSDARWEGLERSSDASGHTWYKNYLETIPHNYKDPKESFSSLWAKINGWDSWTSNPWVWVITFKKINKP